MSAKASFFRHGVIFGSKLIDYFKSSKRIVENIIELNKVYLKNGNPKLKHPHNPLISLE